MKNTILKSKRKKKELKQFASSQIPITQIKKIKGGAIIEDMGVL